MANYELLENAWQLPIVGWAHDFPSVGSPEWRNQLSEYAESNSPPFISVTSKQGKAWTDLTFWCRSFRHQKDGHVVCLLGTRGRGANPNYTWQILAVLTPESDETTFWADWLLVAEGHILAGPGISPEKDVVSQAKLFPGDDATMRLVWFVLSGNSRAPHNQRCVKLYVRHETLKNWSDLDNPLVDEKGVSEEVVKIRPHLGLNVNTTPVLAEVSFAKNATLLRSCRTVIKWEGAYQFAVSLIPVKPTRQYGFDLVLSPLRA